MEKIDVNLVPQATGFQLQKIRLSKKLKKVAYFTVVGWIVIAGTLFGLNWYTASQVDKLNKKQVNLESSMEAFSPEINLQQALRYRVKIAGEVLETRPSYANQLKKMYELLPDQVQLDSIGFNDRELNLSGTLKSIQTLKELEDKAVEVRNTGSYQEIDLRTISLGKDGWKFSLSVLVNNHES